MNDYNPMLKLTFVNKDKNLRGGSQVMSLPKMVLEITIDHVSTLVSQTFKCIFGPLTHFGTDVGLDRFLGSKTQILK